MRWKNQNNERRYCFERLRFKGQIVVVFDNATFERDIFRQVTNLPDVVKQFLNQYEKENKQTWHNRTIPENKIWLKTGGDSLCFRLPTFKMQTQRRILVLFLWSAATLKQFCIHSSSRLQIFRASWAKNKRIKLFLSGDYGFLQKLYGTAGAQSTHLCLYCCNCTAKNPTKNWSDIHSAVVTET